MSKQTSFQTDRVEKEMKSYVKKAMNDCWYHLTDKALVPNHDVITKMSKLMFVVGKLTGKPVDEYIQTITGNDAYCTGTK